MTRKQILCVVLIFLVAAIAGCTASEDPDSLEQDDEPRDRGTGEEDPEDQPVDMTELNETVVAEGYTGHGLGAFAFNTGCDGGPWEPGGPENLGGACFRLEQGTIAVDLEATDDIIPDVAFYARFDNGEGSMFCNEGDLEVPEDASSILVVMTDLGFCLVEENIPGTVPTTGEITLAMHHP